MELSSPTSTRRSRIGFHYYPDTIHYRESDLQTWLPELNALNASWLVLQSPLNRAIPEYFLRGLVQAGIEPLIQINLPLAGPPEPEEAAPLLSVYARWGVHAVLFFDRPNIRSAWPSAGWTQQNLVERFLDLYLPYARLALQYGLVPVLPPLEPGGSYWDTAFLRALLELLEKRGEAQLLQKLVLSAYAWSGAHRLNWGAGGSASWPEARPYAPLTQGEDHRGFRIFDWYLEITQEVLGKKSPIILLGAGAYESNKNGAYQGYPAERHSENVLTIARLLHGESANDPDDPQRVLDPLPAEVAACNFWLLTADPSNPYYPQAWFQAEGKKLPVVRALWEYAAQSKNPQNSAPRFETQPENSPQEKKPFAPSQAPTPPPAGLPIRHYLLLPTYEWGVSDWHLEVIRPFIKKYTPTVGFSLDEATLAAKVTVVGNNNAFPEESLERLRQSGCNVERIGGDGTTIATLLAER